MAERSFKERWRHFTKVAVPGNALVLSHHTMGLLPIDVTSALGAWLGREFAARNKVRDQRVRHNLKMLRPDLAEPAVIDATVRRFWSNAGRSMAEFSVLRRLWVSDRVEPNGLDNLEAARATGRPRIGIFLHLGNWELAGPKLLSLGETSAQIAQTLANPYRNRIAMSVRKVFADQLIEPGPTAGRQIMRSLKETGGLSMAGDEYMNGELLAPAFGRPLHLDGNLGRAVRLAKITNAIIVPYYVLRTKGAHFRLHVTPHLDLDFSGENYLEDGVRKLDEVITPIIVANLDQWLMLDNFKVAKPAPQAPAPSS
jgi:KDO2-lipid IV(A) lauroyltransferase